MVRKEFQDQDLRVVHHCLLCLEIPMHFVTVVSMFLPAMDHNLTFFTLSSNLRTQGLVSRLGHKDQLHFLYGSQRQDDKRIMVDGS